MRKPFAEPAAFAQLLQEAEAKAGQRKFAPVVSVGLDAGYGSIRAILRVPEHYERVQSVLLLDGLHCGYVGGKPGPKESSLVTEDLAVFVQWAATRPPARSSSCSRTRRSFPARSPAPPKRPTTCFSN